MNKRDPLLQLQAVKCNHCKKVIENDYRKEIKQLKEELEQIKNDKFELYLDYIELDNIYNVTYEELQRVKKELKNES